MTCFRCDTLGLLRQRLGRPIIELEETRDYEEARRIVEIAGYAHRRVTIAQALTRISNRRLCSEHGRDPDRLLATDGLGLA